MVPSKSYTEDGDNWMESGGHHNGYVDITGPPYTPQHAEVQHCMAVVLNVGGDG